MANTMTTTTTTEVPCYRCNGTGVYRWGAVINGKSAHSGACYACQGGGEDPPNQGRFRRPRKTQLRTPGLEETTMATTTPYVHPSGWAYWIDCPTHGSLTLRQAAIGQTAYCPACAATWPTAWRGVLGTSSAHQVWDPPMPTHRVRSIKCGDRARRGTGHQCDGRCLSGKRHCDCKCKGRCHGQGVCSCGQEG